MECTSCKADYKVNVFNTEVIEITEKVMVVSSYCPKCKTTVVLTFTPHKHFIEDQPPDS